MFMAKRWIQHFTKKVFFTNFPWIFLVSCKFIQLFSLKTDKIGIVEYLLQNGAEIDAKDNEGRTALHLSIRDGAYVPKPMDKFDVVRMLIKNDAEIDIQDKYGMTPLHLAIQDGLFFWIERNTWQEYFISEIIVDFRRYKGYWNPPFGRSWCEH